MIQAAHLDGVDFDDVYSVCGSGEIAGLYYKFSGVGDYSGLVPEKSLIDEILSKDRIAQKMICVPVFDSLSNWRKPSENGSDNWVDIDDKLSLSTIFQEAAEKSRKYGQCIILPIIKQANGNLFSLSRNIKDVPQGAYIDKIHVIDSNINEIVYSENVSSADYGTPNKIVIGKTSIHPSRVVIFGDKNSFLFSVANDLSEYHEAKKRVKNAVRRNNAFWYSCDFEALIEKYDAQNAVSDTQVNVGQKLSEITQATARALHKNMNESNFAIINKDDKIGSFQLNNISSLIENVSQKMQILSAVSDILLSRLFGKSSTGLSNSGQGDLLTYSQALDGWKAKEIDSNLISFDKIISAVYGIEYSYKDWEWANNRAEDVYLKASGFQEPVVTDGD